MSVPRNLLPSDLAELFGRLGSGSGDLQISGLYADHPDERIREAAYRMFLFPNPGLEAILQRYCFIMIFQSGITNRIVPFRLLKSRYQLSHLVGYESFSERALKSTMAQSPENVLSFLQSLSASLKDPAKVIAVKIPLR